MKPYEMLELLLEIWKADYSRRLFDRREQGLFKLKMFCLRTTSFQFWESWNKTQFTFILYEYGQYLGWIDHFRSIHERDVWCDTSIPLSSLTISNVNFTIYAWGFSLNPIDSSILYHYKAALYKTLYTLVVLS